MFEKLAGKAFYCYLDGYLSYLQIPVVEMNQEKTTFTCPYGSFAYRRMPFGLCNAPSTFQRCMMSIFSDLIVYHYCFPKLRYDMTLGICFDSPEV